jgi:hypothetical protein
MYGLKCSCYKPEQLPANHCYDIAGVTYSFFPPEKWVYGFQSGDCICHMLPMKSYQINDWLIDWFLVF